MMYLLFVILFFFFFNDTATTEIYTLSLHDALPISLAEGVRFLDDEIAVGEAVAVLVDCIDVVGDRKSTRLNSSHSSISYAVFCLKKKKKKQKKQCSQYNKHNISNQHRDIFSVSLD